jgi:nucleotide-binding universal stress UspA family protein
VIKTVLIATDGSSHARKAETLGAAVASKFGARILVLHVLMRSASFRTIYDAFKREGLPTTALDRIANEQVKLPVTSPYGGPILPHVTTDILVQLGEHCLSTAQRALEDEGVKAAEVLLEDGDPADRILAVAEREHADFIVMGHRGFGALRELAAGSVSLKVSHRAPCTVVSVK